MRGTCAKCAWHDIALAICSLLLAAFFFAVAIGLGGKIAVMEGFGGLAVVFAGIGVFCLIIAGGFIALPCAASPNASLAAVAGTPRFSYNSPMSVIPQITTAGQLFEAAGLERCELIRGELVMMSPVGFDHGRIAGNVALVLGGFVKSRSLGIVVAAETGFRIASNPDTVHARTWRSSAPTASRRAA